MNSNLQFDFHGMFCLLFTLPIFTESPLMGLRFFKYPRFVSPIWTLPLFPSFHESSFFWVSSLIFILCFVFVNKWMFRLKETYNSSNFSMEFEREIIDPLIDSEDIGSEDGFNNTGESESFLTFRFQRYEDILEELFRSKPVQADEIEQQLDDRASESSSDDEFYDPAFEPQVIVDSDCSLSDACSKPESFQGDDRNEDPKAEKDDDGRCRVSDSKLFAHEDDDDFEVSSGSDSESSISSSNFSVKSSLPADDFEGKVDLSMMIKGFEIEKGELNKKLSVEEAKFEEFSKGYERDDFEEDEELLEELRGIEEEIEKEKQVSDWEESNGMETQWEHQDLIEQLRMEIGKVKAIGLPTIFEDSEAQKMADDLKPWKIDDKLFSTGGTMDEVHKFYKSYRERMRKFDIFNYQKMYAIGFLRLKDPLQSLSPQKISLATIVSQDCWPCKPKSSATSNSSMLKLTRELESDLETVYVGQLCLSWEFLRWEYGKALALWDSDPQEICRFNQIAGEFQQFQVLLQRFMEDEPFRGSGRVQNYVKNRCVNRRLLQVPVIREDSAKDKMKQMRGGSNNKDAITSVILIEMIEESIRLLWQFIRTDKDSTSSRALNPRRASHTELQNPDDAMILIQVQEVLRQKQKKLKELTRSECCLLRKLQRSNSKQSYSSRVLCFFSEVDMKLVSRVLNMARVTTDQLAWCSSKLQNIEFVDNRIRRDPSFLLFPCS